MAELARIVEIRGHLLTVLHTVEAPAGVRLRVKTGATGTCKISSLQEAFALLNCHRLPARPNTSGVAVLVGFQEHDIAPLVAAKLLTLLGKPAPNAPKYFAAIEVLSCTENRDWVSHATRAIAKHRAANNRPRTSDCDDVRDEESL